MMREELRETDFRKVEIRTEVNEMNHQSPSLKITGKPHSYQVADQRDYNTLCIIAYI